MTNDNQKIRTFIHQRKGKLSGIVTQESEEWLTLKLYGDQQVQYMNGKATEPDGIEIQMRKSFIREVTENGTL